MQTAPLPVNEEARLQALRDLLVLDTPREERFDRIVRFAADEFETASAALSLIDANRQWFKASIGMMVSETARDIAFCSHAILEEDMLVVEDARADARFFDNPLVLGEPGIRFYAGAPLRLSDGHVIGALCVIDTRPRKLTLMERAILRTLRDLAAHELVESPPRRHPGDGEVLACVSRPGAPAFPRYMAV